MGNEYETLSIYELADRVGVSVRTIRYYIAEGLLPSPQGRGKGSNYTQEHLLRLQLIRKLVEKRVPLEEIKKELAFLKSYELEQVVEEQSRASEQEYLAKARSPKDYISTLLQRTQLAESERRSSHRRLSLDYDLPEELLRDEQPPATGRVGSAPEAKEYGRFAEMDSGELFVNLRPPLPSGATAPRHLASEAPAAPETWQRYELAPGIELHVRPEASAKRRRLIRKLLELAREIDPEGER